MPVKNIQNRRLYQQIADQLRGMIDRGEYPPGAYLPPERELSQQFGVSRTSLREALIALEVIGMVKVRVGDGVVVVGPDQTDAADALRGDDGSVLDRAMHQNPWILDPELGIVADFNSELPPFSLLQARRLVEPETAALAASNATEAQIVGIEEAYQRNIADNSQGSNTHPGDRLLHIRIADASGNPAYALFIRHLLGHKYGAMFQRVQELYTSNDMPSHSEKEHGAVVTAIRERNPDAARKAMARHLDSVLKVFSGGKRR
ncbi:FadR/GntR family transcriptional regulator [Solilutibacter silvestris]|uniref:Transcriptional regulator n=1 Tax=Solilutibacter silvestris TaxID=1645665 RepID=A0A2K1Q129_9GAMM|nr:FadR/GntR family transcriptional regulator [Lysobacter silvestris]PNS08724.1 Transcriptional regulator [Lysobacter silvestris]